jgi:aspartyl-tRNA(Asn)/glutamyl-tRNA(Gln) amidotransferase subunit C
MSLTPKQIEQIATLARLDLSEKEKKMYAEQLSVVLDYISMLNEVDTDGVEETCQVTGLEDVVREDEVEDCDEETKVNLIKAFPEKRGNLLKVKGVFQD